VESKYFPSKVILFSGAYKITLSNHKTRAVASPTQPGGGEGAKKNSGGAKYLSSFFQI